MAVFLRLMVRCIRMCVRSDVEVLQEKEMDIDDKKLTSTFVCSQ